MMLPHKMEMKLEHLTFFLYKTIGGMIKNMTVNQWDDKRIVMRVLADASKGS